MNTHVIPMCLMGTKNEKCAYLRRKWRKAGKLQKNTHKYPCVFERIVLLAVVDWCWMAARAPGDLQCL